MNLNSNSVDESKLVFDWIWLIANPPQNEKGPNDDRAWDAISKLEHHNSIEDHNFQKYWSHLIDPQ